MRVLRIARRLPALIYRWAVIILAYWFLSYLFHMLDFDAAGDMVLLLCMGVLAEWFAVTFPQGQLCATFAVVFSAYIIFGPAGAVWITALACLLGQLLARNNSLPTILFNAAQYVLGIAGGDYIYMYLGGSAGGRLAWGNALPLLGFMLTCFILNQALVYLYLLPGRKNNPIVFWRDALKWDGLTYLITTPLGALMAGVYTSIGSWGVIFFFLPVLLMQYVLRLNVHLELANRELRALYGLTAGLGKGVGVDEILALALKEARRVIRYHTGIFYLWSAEKGCYVARSVEGAYREQLKKSIVLPGQEFLGCLAQSGEPAVIYDSRRDPRVNVQSGLTQVHRSLLVLPLQLKQEVLGLFVLGDKNPFVFDEQHLHLFAALTGPVTTLVANAALEDRLRRQSEVMEKHDLATGLYNRSYFLSNLRREMDDRPEGSPLSVILMDVDRLTKLNHAYGYQAGDAVLSLVGRTMSSVVGSKGLAARFDGEEFIVLLPGVGEAAAAQLAQSIAGAVANSTVKSGDNYYGARVSSGVASCPGDAQDADRLLCKAELAVRRAKENGRHQVQVYSLMGLPGTGKGALAALLQRKKGTGGT